MGHELHNASSEPSAGNTEAIVLYGAAPSPCVRRVIICLLEKGLDFDWVEIDLPNMEQRSAAYLALNPNGFVPTLSHGERVIFESSVINEYLEEQFPERQLFPADSYQRAQVRMWIAAEGAMAKLFRPAMYQRLLGPVMHVSRTAEEAHRIASRSTDDATDIEWEQKVWDLQVLTRQEEADKLQQLLAWADIVERALQGKDFLVGENFSMADISVYPRVAMYSWCGLRLDAQRFPNILRWMATLEQHPSFEQSLSEQAKKLRGLASSPLMAKLRNTLSKDRTKRSLADKLFLRVMGKFLRKAQGVDKLLAGTAQQRALPLPQKNNAPAPARPVETPISGYTGDFILCSYGRSPFCQRIALLMDSLGLAYTTREIDIIAGEHESLDFLRINPLGDVPVLQHGERIIYNSETIAEYLIGEFATAGSWQPLDSESRARHRMWLAHESGTHKELKPLWDRYVAKKANPQAFITNEENALVRIMDKLQTLEYSLADQSFLMGDKPQFADIAWYTQLQSLKQVPGFKLQSLPHLSRWDQQLARILEQTSDAAMPQQPAASA